MSTNFPLHCFQKENISKERGFPKRYPQPRSSPRDGMDVRGTSFIVATKKSAIHHLAAHMAQICVSAGCL